MLELVHLTILQLEGWYLTNTLLEWKHFEMIHNHVLSVEHVLRQSPVFFV